MGFESSLNALAKAFIVFFLACAAIGRPDIPMRAIAELRAKALAGTSASWGCPSAFHKESCTSYNSARYR